MLDVLFTLDWTAYLSLMPIIGQLGGGYQESSSQSFSEQGGPLFTPGSRLRYETSLPIAAAFTRGLPLAQAMSEKTTPYTLPGLTSTGLYEPQQNAFSEAVRQALSQTSGNFAQRGFNRPENIQAIAGSAAQNVAPQFAPLIGQNIQAQAQVPLLQNQLDTARLTQLMNYLGLGANLLGGQSQSFSGSSSFGVQGGFDNRAKP